MSEVEIKNFRNQPVVIQVGDADKDGKRLEVTIRDISYGNHIKFKQLLSNLWMKAQTAPQTAKYFDEIIRQQVSKGASIEKSIMSIIGGVNEIYKTASEDEKVQLLEVLTDGQINKDNVDALQVGEVYNLLTWLIERNMSAEKNFEASLNSILNPKIQDNEKK